MNFNRAISISPNESYAYVANFVNNSISIIKLGTFNYRVINPGTYNVELKTNGNSKYSPTEITKSFTIYNKTTTVPTKVNKTIVPTKAYKPSNNLYEYIILVVIIILVIVALYYIVSKRKKQV